MVRALPTARMSLLLGLVLSVFASPATPTVAQTANRATPIQHLVIIFGENISFDHYFGTYPVATNPTGEPSFTAAPGTPSVNGLSDVLLSQNPNLDNPFRFDRGQAV